MKKKPAKTATKTAKKKPPTTKRNGKPPKGPRTSLYINLGAPHFIGTVVPPRTLPNRNDIASLTACLQKLRNVWKAYVNEPGCNRPGSEFLDWLRDNYKWHIVASDQVVVVD